MPLEAARTRLLCARMLTERGPEVAVAEVRLAFAVFEDLGAGGDAWVTSPMFAVGDRFRLSPCPKSQASAEAFGGRMVGVLNDACLALMTSIGHQVGLFDTLAGLPPATSQQIADAAALQNATSANGSAP